MLHSQLMTGNDSRLSKFYQKYKEGVKSSGIMDTEMKKYLVIIGFEEDIEEVPKMKTVLKMWRQSARIGHPDKGGEKSKFQELQDALEKIIEIIKFNEFNCKKENSNSLTIYIEKERLEQWHSILCESYGEPKIFRIRMKTMEDIEAAMDIILMKCLKRS